jgi:hypothetical protein
MTGANSTRQRQEVTPVYSVDTQQRLASASVVFFGHYGDVTRLAQQRDLCRQSLYRQAHQVARATEGIDHTQQIQQLQETIGRLQLEIDTLRQQLRLAVTIDSDRQAEFASVSAAEGVSLPLAHRLLHILLKERTPSVSQLGRWSKDAARRANATLAVLDDFSRPLVKDAALDELFVRRTPLLMVVELGSLVWVSGQLSPSRDGAAWAEQLRQLPALQFVSRDAGKGLDAGIALVNAERAKQQKTALDDQDDHFHLLREATRALRKLQGQVSHAMEKAEKADRKRAKVARQGRTTSGTGSVAARAWRKAEAAFQRWSAADEAWQRVRQEALPLFTVSGQLNSRARAEAVLAQTLSALDGPEWAKVRRLLQRRGYFTFLDRVGKQLATLPAAPELVQAAVEVEGGRRRPEASAGSQPSAQGYRAIVLLAGVMLALAGDSGSVAQSLVRGVLRRAYRASSAVEGLNSIVRMHQSRHRRLTQGLLDLKRLNWNCREFRTGKRKKQTPYGLLGLKLPTTDWWQLLKIRPEQLRQQLSAQQLAA